MTLICDVGDVPDCHCTDMLETMAKAMAESPDGSDRSMWTPHDNPFLTAHVEQITARLQAILQALQNALSTALFGRPIGELSKALVPWRQWDEARFEQVRQMLQAKPSSSYTLADWTLLVDWLIQRYLPDGVIQTEAEFLTVRGSLLGKIEAAVSASSNIPPPDELADWANLIPTAFAAVPPRALSPIETSILHVAQQRAAINIGVISEVARARMKAIVVEHVQAQVLGQKEGTAQALRQRLFDEFGQLNRDFRRIAVTEAGECASQGFIAAQPYGAKVRRVEAYRGACAFCRSIDGRVMTVVDPASPQKNGETEVWLGKTNIGRSASPRMKVGNALMERGINQRWWIAAGVQHPQCRGGWTVVPTAAMHPNVSLAFAAYAEEMATKFRNQVS